MKMKVVVCSVVISLFCVVVLTSSHSLAKNGPEVPVLSKKGQLLESHYAAELESLRKEIKKALPTLDSRKVANFLKAAELERELAEGNCFQRLVTHNKDHAKRVSSAAAQLAEAKENLKKAEASPDDQKAEAVKTAEEELAKKEKNYENSRTSIWIASWPATNSIRCY